MVKVDWQRNLSLYFYLPQRQFHHTLLHQLSLVAYDFGLSNNRSCLGKKYTIPSAWHACDNLYNFIGSFPERRGKGCIPCTLRSLAPTSQPRVSSNFRAVPTALCVYNDSSTSKLCLKFLNLLVLPEPELRESEIFLVKKHLATTLNVLKARMPLVPKTSLSVVFSLRAWLPGWS